MRTWLFAIAKRRVADWHRKQTTRRRALAGLVQRNQFGSRAPDAALLAAEKIKTLPPECRKIVMLRGMQGKSVVEVAAALKLSPGQVYSRLRLVRAALR